MKDIAHIKKLVERIHPAMVYVKKQSGFHSDIFLFRPMQHDNNPPLLIKQYKKKDPIDLEYEFTVMSEFYLKMDVKSAVQSPKPISFDKETRTITMEYINGTSFKKYLLRFFCPNSNELSNNINLVASGLAKFHQLYKQTEFLRPFDSPFLLKMTHSEIDYFWNQVSKCELKYPVLSFLDYTPQNLLLKNSCLYIVDFPEKKCISTPHLDLARFKFELFFLQEYPQLRFFKMKCWDLDTVFKNFIEKYCTIMGTQFNSYDEKLISFFNTKYAEYLEIYYQESNDLKLKIEYLYVKKLLNSLQESTIDSPSDLMKI